MAKTSTTKSRCCATEASGGDDPVVSTPPTAKAKNLSCLRRAEAQVGRIREMVERGSSGTEVLQRLSAAHEALRSVGRDVLRDHLRHSAIAAMRGGDDDEARKVFEELLDLFRKHGC